MWVDSSRPGAIDWSPSGTLVDGDLLCQTIQVEVPICFNPFVDRRLAMNVWKMIQLRNTLTMTFDSCEALHKVSIVPIAVILVYGTMPHLVIRVGKLRYTRS